MKILRITFIGLILTLLAGCLNEERAYVAFSKLKTGMTQVELNAILGAPEKTETNAGFVVWTYPEGAVFFREGKVYSWTVTPLKPY